MRQRLHLTLSLAFAASLLLSLRPVACFACPDPACDTPISVSASPNPVCVGQTVTITKFDQDKNDTGQPVEDNVNITWDGGSAPPTSFSAAGTYNYTARTDNVGAPNLCNETGVHTITITVVTVASISGTDYVCINEDAVFTAATNPAGNESMISWSGGGTPATGSGSSFTTKWTTAGTYTVKASCGSCGTSACSKEKQVIVQAPTVSMLVPTDGQKLIGDMSPQEYRQQRQFLMSFSAQVSCATDQTSVIFIYTKNGVSGQVSGSRRGTDNIWDYDDFDIRQRYTSQSGRYHVKARATVGGQTYESTEHWFCILKGEQIMQVAQDWLHYPYHWGGKGPDACNHDTSHGTPVDGSTNHEPYDNDHPSGDGWHPCCFDCSGYAWKCLSYCGISLPNGNAAHQYSDLNAEFGDPSSPLAGDLLFRDRDKPPYDIVHVMISRGGGSYYNAPHTGAWTEPGSGSYDHTAGPSAAGWCMDGSCSH